MADETPPRTVVLFHWQDAVSPGVLARLDAAGFHVQPHRPAGPSLLQDVAVAAPVAILIDLDRRPATGRDLALFLRQRKATRALPLILVGGDPAPVAAMRDLLPDATYTPWADIVPALQQALATPPRDLVVPRSQFVPYAGRSTAAKLGLRPGGAALLVAAPAGVVAALEPLPAGVEVITVARDQPIKRPAQAILLWFVRSRAELARDLAAVADQTQAGPVWLAWPKQKGSLAGDLTLPWVRQTGLAAGLVDFKICSLDDTWSALCFAWRGPPEETA